MQLNSLTKFPLLLPHQSCYSATPFSFIFPLLLNVHHRTYLVHFRLLNFTLPCYCLFFCFSLFGDSDCSVREYLCANILHQNFLRFIPPPPLSLNAIMTATREQCLDYHQSSAGSLSTSSCEHWRALTLWAFQIGSWYTLVS